MYEIVITQISKTFYCWVLRQVSPYKVLAVSQLMSDKSTVEIEANSLAVEFGLFVDYEEN